MPKEMFETTVERKSGENWGLVIVGGKDMVISYFLYFPFPGIYFSFVCRSREVPDIY